MCIQHCASCIQAFIPLFIQFIHSLLYSFNLYLHHQILLNYSCIHPVHSFSYSYIHPIIHIFIQFIQSFTFITTHHSFIGSCSQFYSIHSFNSFMYILIHPSSHTIRSFIHVHSCTFITTQCTLIHSCAFNIAHHAVKHSFLYSFIFYIPLGFYIHHSFCGGIPLLPLGVLWREVDEQVGLVGLLLGCGFHT